MNTLEKEIEYISKSDFGLMTINTGEGRYKGDMHGMLRKSFDAMVVEYNKRKQEIETENMTETIRQVNNQLMDILSPTAPFLPREMMDGLVGGKTNNKQKE